MIQEELLGNDGVQTPNLSTYPGRFVAFIIFFILGVGNLLPWNAFITASSYYQNRFCGTPYENSFESYFSMFYTVSQPVGLLATIYFKRHFTTKTLVLYPLILYTVVFVVNTILVTATSFSQVGLFTLTIISTFLCGLSSSVMNGGLFGLSGILPSAYTGAIMSGQGLAGTAVSAVNLLIVGVSAAHHCRKNDFDDDDSVQCDDVHRLDAGALSYFIVATVTLAVCVILFQQLLQLPFVKHHMRQHLKEHLMDSAAEENPMHFGLQENNYHSAVPMTLPISDPIPIVNNHSQFVVTSDASGSYTVETQLLFSGGAIASETQQQAAVIQLRPKHEQKRQEEQEKVVKHTQQDDEQFAELVNDVQSPPLPQAQRHRVTTAEILDVLYQIRLPAISVFLVFAGTLSVFPSIMVLIQPQHSCAASPLFSDDLWVPFLFLLLNLSDFLGRLSGPMMKAHHSLRKWCSPEIVFAGSLTRLVIPLFFCLSNIEDNHLPIVTKNDGVTWLLTILLGYSNGLMANIAMMQGPDIIATAGAMAGVNEGEKTSLAGTIMIFCLSSGLLVGACLSMLLVYIVLGSE
jgi:hypothetical protein